MKSSSKSSLTVVLFVLLLSIAWVFFSAWIIQVTYNNSIVPMSKDPETKKPRLEETTYWQSFALSFLAFFLLPGSIAIVSMAKK